MSDRKGQLELALLAYLAHRDVSPADVCRASGLDQQYLREGRALTVKQTNDLWLQAAKASGDSLLGLHLGESLQLAALGVVGEVIKYSTTVGGALSTAATLTPSLTGLVEVVVGKTRQALVIAIKPSLPPGEALTFAHRQTLDLVMAFIVHELDGLLLTKIVPKAVHYADPLPGSGEYARIFRVAPSKKGKSYAILLDPSAWDIPVLTGDFQMQEALLEKVQTLIHNPTPAFHDRIYRHLLSNAYRGILSQTDVAANLNLSTRSLQRRLREEGATFSDLTEKVRKTLALHYVQTGRYPLKEISDMLGYNECSAFSRAFKRWTGHAPRRHPLP